MIPRRTRDYTVSFFLLGFAVVSARFLALAFDDWLAGVSALFDVNANEGGEPFLPES